MLNNETWLVHSNLFKKHWAIETKEWARTLGWFGDLVDTVKQENGWCLWGEKQLTLHDYITIIDEINSEKKLYCFKEDKWSHMAGPVLFVVRKNSEEVFVAGWAGDKNLLKKLKSKTDNPWEWEGISLIEVDPLAAIYAVKGTLKKPRTAFPVFFLSNGETNAEENWQHLKRLTPQAQRIDGILGRRKAFLECATRAGDSSHFFVVTGKNYITDVTVFDFTPTDTTPKAHIMFQAKNMSNRLEYGHMGVGLYNKDIVLNTPENFGLDFTEFGGVYLIPKTVSEATFATTPYEAWRTAFREAVKLTLSDSVTAKTWLQRWVTFAEGENADWVLQGAKEGHEFALENKNNLDELKKSVDWEWLEKRFEVFGHLKLL